MLEEERAYYNDHLQDWLDRIADRYVLIKGRELVGVYNTDQEALADATRRFGLSSFLVRQVRPTEPEINIPALTLGLLRADSARPV